MPWPAVYPFKIFVPAVGLWRQVRDSLFHACLSWGKWSHIWYGRLKIQSHPFYHHSLQQCKNRLHCMLWCWWLGVLGTNFLEGKSFSFPSVSPVITTGMLLSPVVTGLWGTEGLVLSPNHFSLSLSYVKHGAQNSVIIPSEVWLVRKRVELCDLVTLCLG